MKRLVLTAGLLSLLGLGFGQSSPVQCEQGTYAQRVGLLGKVRESTGNVQKRSEYGHTWTAINPSTALNSGDLIHIGNDAILAFSIKNSERPNATVSGNRTVRLRGPLSFKLSHDLLRPFRLGAMNEASLLSYSNSQQSSQSNPDELPKEESIISDMSNAWSGLIDVSPTKASLHNQDYKKTPLDGSAGTQGTIRLSHAGKEFYLLAAELPAHFTLRWTDDAQSTDDKFYRIKVTEIDQSESRHQNRTKFTIDREVEGRVYSLKLPSVGSYVVQVSDLNGKFYSKPYTIRVLDKRYPSGPKAIVMDPDEKNKPKGSTNLKLLPLDFPRGDLLVRTSQLPYPMDFSSKPETHPTKFQGPFKNETLYQLTLLNKSNNEAERYFNRSGSFHLTLQTGVYLWQIAKKEMLSGNREYTIIARSAAFTATIEQKQDTHWGKWLSTHLKRQNSSGNLTLYVDHPLD